jgi:anti-sigma B factor antagonist
MSDFPRKDFSVRTEQHGGAVVVVPSGELDIATAPTLEEALQRAIATNPTRVVLDLRELEFIDSSGLRTLLMARRQAEIAGAHFALVAGDRALERTLEIAGIHALFEWVPSEHLA